MLPRPATSSSPLFEQDTQDQLDQDQDQDDHSTSSSGPPAETTGQTPLRSCSAALLPVGALSLTEFCRCRWAEPHHFLCVLQELQGGPTWEAEGPVPELQTEHTDCEPGENSCHTLSQR